jgi:MoxR-like ATPase
MTATVTSIDTARHAHAAPQDVADAAARLRAGLDELRGIFAERDRVIAGAAVAALCREHVIMIGPPGVAKSAITKAFSTLFYGAADTFVTQASAFTTPEDLFGDFDMLEMQRTGRRVRVTAGKLWGCKMAHLDEVFRINGGARDALLTTLEERRADHDGARNIPLDLVIGSANSYPEPGEADAFWDRLALRFWVDEIVDDDAFERVLLHRGPLAGKLRLEDDDLETLRDAVERVDLTSVAATCKILRKAFAAEGFVISTRRWRKALKVLAAAATLAGRATVRREDYAILGDMLWNRHSERDRVLSIIANTVDPYSARAEAIVDTVKGAMTGIFLFEQVVSGQLSQPEALAKVAKVAGALAAERGKLSRTLAAAEERTPALANAEAVVAAASETVQALFNQVSMHHPG